MLFQGSPHVGEPGWAETGLHLLEEHALLEPDVVVDEPAELGQEVARDWTRAKRLLEADNQARDLEVLRAQPRDRLGVGRFDRGEEHVLLVREVAEHRTVPVLEEGARGRGGRPGLPRRRVPEAKGPHERVVVVPGERDEGGIALQPRPGRQIGKGPTTHDYSAFGTGGGPAGMDGV